MTTRTRKTKPAETVAPTVEAAGTEDRRRLMAGELTVSFNALAPSVQISFNQLQSMVFAWMQAQGFWESSNFGEKIALIHSEVSECLEAHRKNLRSDHIPDFDGVTEELADAVIRILDLAGSSNLPLGQAIIAKLQYNLTRPVKHDKAY